MTVFRRFPSRFCTIGRHIIGRHIAARIQMPCPLCDGPAHSGRLCPGCTADVRHSMRHHPWRCARCALALPADIDCPDCACEPGPLQTVVAAFDYISPADSLILRYKNARQFQLATTFAWLAFDALRETRPDWLLPSGPCDAQLIPIAASQRSLRRRGFNPASEFATQLARLLNIPVEHSLLYRETDRQKQTTLNRDQRRANTAHLYYCARNSSLARAILVDDVVTTGSTLNAAARALAAAGVKQVCAVVIARTPCQALRMNE